MPKTQAEMAILNSLLKLFVQGIEIEGDEVRFKAHEAAAPTLRQRFTEEEANRAIRSLLGGNKKKGKGKRQGFTANEFLLSSKDGRAFHEAILRGSVGSCVRGRLGRGKQSAR